MTRGYETYAPQGLGSCANEGYGIELDNLSGMSGSGAYLSLPDGRRYLDTAMGAGCAILGHAPDCVIEAVNAQISKGSVFARPTENASRYSKLLCEMMPWFENFVFCSTGSEATMRAIRIARAFTGKTKIAMFSGGWHGSHDMVLMDEDPGSPEAAPRVRRKSPGTPKWCEDDMVLLPYNHNAAFDLIRQHANDLAVVLVEPAQGSNPRSDIKDFLRELRQVTKDNDVLLCFDEIITGARLSPGGGQEYLDIYADLATYGKAFGGGLPIGAISGRPDVMRTVREGSRDNPRSIFMGGTFSANPLSMAAGMAMMTELKNGGPDLYQALNGKGESLRARVNEFIDANEIKAHMIGIGSMSRIIFTDQPVRSRHQRDQLEWDYGEQGAFFKRVLEQGVHVASNKILFLSTAHTDLMLEELTKVLTTTLLEFKEKGVL